MKKHTKLIALILVFALLLSMAGCASKGSGDPGTKEPAAVDTYTQASAALGNASDVTLELLITTYTTVAGEKFSQQSSQTLTYHANGTDDAVIGLEEEMYFDIHDEDFDPEDEDDEPYRYHEIWTQGTVYATLEEEYRFCGPVDAEAAAARYTPAVLLDAALYSSITAESTDAGTRITFADPTAAESWAMPQEGELTEASGTALVSSSGALKQMRYTITYTYGPAQITLEVESKPLATPKTVAAPEDVSDYTTISDIDALRTTIKAPSMLMQANSVTSSGVESILSHAAGFMFNQSVVLNAHGHKDELKAKFDTGIFMMDYTTMESEDYDLEETYINGKMTTVVNDGLPSTNRVDREDVSSHITEQLLLGLLECDYWEDVTITDLGSLYFLEYTLNDNFGNSQQNDICDMFWNDPSFLYDLSSAYENTALEGYLSVDKYTGLPVAAGYYYEGVHTLDDYEYPLSRQFDQSFEAPAKGAYEEITDEKLPEEEPENKPTPLFYHVTGEDGQEMWLFGTIHVGDERTAYLPQEIRDAFAASDALALECDTDAFDEQLEEDDALSEQVSNLYFTSDPDMTVEGQMDDEEYEEALRYLKAIGGYTMNMPFAKPYVWSNTIDMFHLRRGYQLHSDQGVEERLTTWAEELDKEILEVESSLFQLEMLTGFPIDVQMMLLEASLEYTAREYWEETMDLYEKWCAGDEEILRETISDEVDTSEMDEEELAEYEAMKPLIDAYNKAMSIDRNEGMLDKAIEYLESGDVVFYAVGLAHLLDSTNGLVDTLRQAGYTVELVTYGE